MYSKTLLVSVAFLSAASSVTAHALIEPALGVKGKGNRGNVGRPNNGQECGNANVGGSTPAQADASGAFSVTGQSFNGGRDGSTQVTMTVDVTGKGNGAKFAQLGSVTKNGNANPGGSEQGVAIQATLGAGTKCTGPGNTCVVAFKTAGGFGNCVLVKQGAGGGAAAAAPAAAPAAGAGGAAAPPAAAAPGGAKAGAKAGGAKAGGAKAGGKKPAGAKKGGKKGNKKGKKAGGKKAAAKPAAGANAQGAKVEKEIDQRFAAAQKGAAGVKARELDARAILTRAPRMARSRMIEFDLD